MMRINSTFKNLLLLFTSIPFLFGFIARKQNYQVECVSQKIEGYVTLKIWSPEKGRKYSNSQAGKDAVYAILFEGVAGKNGCVTQQPLLTNREIHEFNKHNLNKTLFGKKSEWKRFVSESSIFKSQEFEARNQVYIIYEITIAKKLLRKYLETNQVLKPLNDGF